MPWTDIHSGSNQVHMWATNGVGYIDLLSASVNLTGWGSTANIGRVNNSAFYPVVGEGFYGSTRDGYFPTVVSVREDGNVRLEYAGGASGGRVVSSIFNYNIG